MITALLVQLLVMRDYNVSTTFYHTHSISMNNFILFSIIVILSLSQTHSAFVHRTVTSTFATGKPLAAEKRNNHEKWQPFYEALTEYKKQHGHCEVTIEDDPELLEWLEDQRKSYRQMQLGRKTKLTKKRAVALEMVGAIPPELLDMWNMNWQREKS